MRGRLRIAPAMALAWLAACGQAPVPGRALSITGNSLRYQARPDGFTGGDRFSWSVTADQSYLRYDGTSLSKGSVRVTFVDGAGQVVLDQTLASGAPPANGPTKQGQVGAWQVRLDFEAATGAVALSAEGSR